MYPGKRLILTPPTAVEEVVLHTCCAPCSSAVIECLMENGIKPLVFYFNPNIYPLEEYEKRKAECSRYAGSLGLTVIDGDYGHACWLECIKGLEQEPERGLRCYRCFELRLSATARYASEHGYKVFCTTLASSRWKDLMQINAAGRYAASLYPPAVFWEQNWRKGGLSERRNILVREHGFYNQQYCGCEFSRLIQPDDQRKGDRE